MQEEETPQNGSGGGGGGGTQAYLWWAGVSAAQLGWAVVSSRKGAGNSTLMPFKAFGVASLYVGSLATAAFAGLQASGIRKVEDLVELGANIRTGLGVHRRARDE